VKANEFVRWELFSTLAILVREERLERSRVIDFLRNCFTTLPQETDSIWFGWQDAISRLAAGDLEPMVRQVFDNEFICTSLCDYAEFKTDLDDASKSGTAVAWRHDERYTSFGSVIEEMADWACFTEMTHSKPGISDSELRDVLHDILATRALERSSLPLEPEINDMRFVGRNDPCPCKSGKKYKKCCLN
jgi:Protein of unknown function (DUF1186)/SEC-C motif